MPENTGKILKRDAVTITGQRELGRSAPRSSGSPHRPARAQGRIVEQNENGAIVEITCGCGEILHLHCTYGNQLDPAAGQ